MQWKPKKHIKKQIPDVDIHPIVAQLLLQRNITTKKDVDDFFASDYDKNLHDPFLFSAMHRVVERVQQAKEKGEKIGIFGDHDADGVSSATVLAEGLEELGFSVSVYIPDKMTEGHGINTTAIDQFAQEGVTLLFSVDCGTSNVDAVAYANDKGIDVIITDHHHAPEVLPDAFAIINPQLPGETYPFKELSGTAVAFKVVQALFTACAPERVEQLKWLLDVVCVGTVADCMPLLGENRVLVKYGLIVLSKTRRKGYQKLISVGNIPINRWSVPTADVIAFQIAPRINAAGRMSHAKHAYALLREKDDTRATKKAQDIEKQNRDRQRLVAKIVQDVEDVIRAQKLDNNAFIVASSKDYPIGIVGIVAGRIAEKYQKPTGIFTEDGDMARGSFRSVDGVHVVDVLQSCEKYLDKYGGHEKAAGATLKTKHLPDFARALDKKVAKMLTQKMREVHRLYDMEIALADVDFDLLEDLQKCEPFGEQNEEPIFYIKNLVVEQARAVGNNAKHLKMRLRDKEGKTTVDAIGFWLGTEYGQLTPGETVDVYASVQENEWMGQVSVQLRLYDLQCK